MATAKKTTTFGVSCPHCHDEDATLAIDLADLDVVRCSNCDSEFSPQMAYEMVMEEAARWAKVVRWAEAAKEMLSRG